MDKVKQLSISEMDKLNQINHWIHFGRLSISNTDYSIRIRHLTFEEDIEKKIELSPKEFAILKLLSEHPNQIWSRTQIIENVWGVNSSISHRIIDSHIYSIRKKLGPLENYLISTRGFGYQLSMIHEELQSFKLNN